MLACEQLVLQQVWKLRVYSAPWVRCLLSWVDDFERWLILLFYAWNPLTWLLFCLSCSLNQYLFE
jgi:hypothetical protein